MGGMPGTGATGGTPGTAQGAGAAQGAGGMPDFSALMGMMGGGGGGGAYGGGGPAPVANPEEAYAVQIQQLVDMVRCCLPTLAAMRRQVMEWVLCYQSR